ncbi:hypothetical protein ABID56_000418 [Alkalibacillus flavidus]|uniref:Heptaprenyl diphosphate synthase n=1 Tax=Alkalibacillus flavidus TaxID=546021 RepID=A0ABV2KRW5_9BACI
MVGDYNFETFRQTFLNQYKHDYIRESMYEPMFNTALLPHLYELVQPLNHILADALVNMQLSLNVHDVVERDGLQDLSTTRLKHNQLHVLMGDYHSALFYQLLSNHHETDALYFFLPYIKQINEHKIELIHHHLSPTERLEKVLYVYSQLIYAATRYLNLDYDHHVVQKLLLQSSNDLPLFWMGSNDEMKTLIQERLDIRQPHAENEKG